jgi:ABC-type amino acid transport system permease subunit
MAHVETVPYIYHDPSDDAVGEGVKFTDLVAVVQTIIRAHGLHKVAKRRQVEFGISIDAAQITKSLSHVTLMLTYIDAGAMDPRTKIPFFLQGNTMHKVRFHGKLLFLLFEGF